jgi:hypothetical protein
MRKEPLYPHIRSKTSQVWYRGATADENKEYSFWTTKKEVALSYAGARGGVLYTAQLKSHKACRVFELELLDRINVVMQYMTNNIQNVTEAIGEAMKKTGCDVLLLTDDQAVIANYVLDYK